MKKRVILLVILIISLSAILFSGGIAVFADEGASDGEIQINQSITDLLEDLDLSELQKYLDENSGNFLFNFGSNAKEIVDTFDKDAKIIFGPDRNLGNYINSVTGRSMLLWDGACHVHEKFSVEKTAQLKAQHPDAKVLVHPECTNPLRLLADCIGSTAVLLKYAVESNADKFIVATESGILHQMRSKCPEKTFIPAPPSDSTCACNECAYMKLNTLEKLRNCLRDMAPEVTVDTHIAEKARKPIEKMLELSSKNKYTSIIIWNTIIRISKPNGRNIGKTTKPIKLR